MITNLQTWESGFEFLKQLQSHEGPVMENMMDHQAEEYIFVQK